MIEDLVRFVTESNAIEGILRAPTDAEIHVTEGFLALPKVNVFNVRALVAIYQPDAVLRDRRGLDVRVGSYYPPAGGPHIHENLETLLANAPSRDPWAVHVDYEALHPFTDGNGRSGRALWAWQMIRQPRSGGLSLGFLHRFYYQTLAQVRR